MNKIALAFLNFTSSFDGERISYGDFERRMSRIMDRVNSGPELDFLNFTRDMQNAIKHEDEQREKIRG